MPKPFSEFMSEFRSLSLSVSVGGRCFARRSIQDDVVVCTPTFLQDVAFPDVDARQRHYLQLRKPLTGGLSQRKEIVRVVMTLDVPQMSLTRTHTGGEIMVGMVPVANTCVMWPSWCQVSSRGCQEFANGAARAQNTPSELQVLK
ncbi:hypothetical protein C0Q70_13695 [Pomacea canaliculata]|uniref:Uncharacterized protein n=1 Tax=Pomacea canaliculata TaxID=400727 RepID=A0A2T7NXX4_POMCA|nr:hypothetical protein C0Q70_13695 [Pomacea canaliculata]